MSFKMTLVIQLYALVEIGEKSAKEIEFATEHVPSPIHSFLVDNPLEGVYGGTIPLQSQRRKTGY